MAAPTTTMKSTRRQWECTKVASVHSVGLRLLSVGAEAPLCRYLELRERWRELSVSPR
jgi:hypothetical protein